MNPDHNEQLATRIDRALKELPELSAPETLAVRVMARIERRSARPWYQQAWPAWPLPVQVVSLVAMLGLFGGIWFAGWRLSQGVQVELAAQNLAGCFSSLGVVCNVLGAILGATILAVKKLGSGFLIAGLAIAICNYFACVGLGTMAVRFTRARIGNNKTSI